MNINFIIDKHRPKITGIATLENSDEYYRCLVKSLLIPLLSDIYL